MKPEDIEVALKTVNKKLTEYEDRLQRVEAQVEIQNLMNRYCLAADCGNDELVMACYSEQGQYLVSVPQEAKDLGYDDLVLEGREAIGEMIRGDGHQNLLPYSAHTVGPSEVRVDGDKAEAIGYSGFTWLTLSYPT